MSLKWLSTLFYVLFSVQSFAVCLTFEQGTRFNCARPFGEEGEKQNEICQELYGAEYEAFINEEPNCTEAKARELRGETSAKELVSGLSSKFDEVAKFIEILGAKETLASNEVYPIKKRKIKESFNQAQIDKVQELMKDLKSALLLKSNLLITPIEMNTPQGLKFLGYLELYHQFQKQLYFLSSMYFHYLNKEIISIKKLEKLNLKLNKLWGIELYGNARYKTKSAGNNHVEILVSEEALQSFEIQTLKGPTTEKQYIKLLQMYSLKESLVNHWSAQRMSAQKIPVKSEYLCQVDFLSFRNPDKIALTETPAYKELTQYDLYSEGFYENLGELIKASYEPILMNERLSENLMAEILYRENDLSRDALDRFINHDQFNIKNRDDLILSVKDFAREYIQKQEIAAWPLDALATISNAIMIDDNLAVNQIAGELANQVLNKKIEIIQAQFKSIFSAMNNEEIEQINSKVDLYIRQNSRKWWSELSQKFTKVLAKFEDGVFSKEVVKINRAAKKESIYKIAEKYAKANIIRQAFHIDSDPNVKIINNSIWDTIGFTNANHLLQIVNYRINTDDKLLNSFDKFSDLSEDYKELMSELQESLKEIELQKMQTEISDMAIQENIAKAVLKMSQKLYSKYTFTDNDIKALSLKDWEKELDEDRKEKERIFAKAGSGIKAQKDENACEPKNDKNFFMKWYDNIGDRINFFVRELKYDYFDHKGFKTLDPNQENNLQKLRLTKKALTKKQAAFRVLYSLGTSDLVRSRNPQSKLDKKYGITKWPTISMRKMVAEYQVGQAYQLEHLLKYNLGRKKKVVRQYFHEGHGKTAVHYEDVPETLLDRISKLYNQDRGTLPKTESYELIETVLTQVVQNNFDKFETFCSFNLKNYKDNNHFRKMFKSISTLKQKVISDHKDNEACYPIAGIDEDIAKSIRTNSEVLRDNVDNLLMGLGIISIAAMVVFSGGIAAGGVAASLPLLIELTAVIGFVSATANLKVEFVEKPKVLTFHQSLSKSQIRSDFYTDQQAVAAHLSEQKMGKGMAIGLVFVELGFSGFIYKEFMQYSGSKAAKSFLKYGIKTRSFGRPPLASIMRSPLKSHIKKKGIYKGVKSYIRQNTDNLLKWTPRYQHLTRDQYFNMIKLSLKRTGNKIDKLKDSPWELLSQIRLYRLKVSRSVKLDQIAYEEILLKFGRDSDNAINMLAKKRINEKLLKRYNRLVDSLELLKNDARNINLIKDQSLFSYWVDSRTIGDLDALGKASLEQNKWYFKKRNITLLGELKSAFKEADLIKNTIRILKDSDGNPIPRSEVNDDLYEFVVESDL